MDENDSEFIQETIKSRTPIEVSKCINIQQRNILKPKLKDGKCFVIAGKMGDSKIRLKPSNQGKQNK